MVLIYHCRFHLEPHKKGGDAMSYDYRRLEGKIVEVFETQAKFADVMGLSERSVSLKLNNHIEWKQTEISKAANLLNISAAEIPNYFFAERV